MVAGIILEWRTDEAIMEELAGNQVEEHDPERGIKVRNYVGTNVDVFVYGDISSSFDPW